MAVGLGLFMLGSRDLKLNASLSTGQGSSTLDAAAPAGEHISQAIMPASFLIDAQATVSSAQLVIGMLVILVGLGMHALLYSIQQRTKHSV